jgi:hypothetical protein
MITQVAAKRLGIGCVRLELMIDVHCPHGSGAAMTMGCKV